MITINKKTEGHAISHNPTVPGGPAFSQIGELVQQGNRHHLFYILNTVFFVIISFISGYNLKGYQLRTSIQDGLTTTHGYVEKTKANYEESQQILENMETLNNIHFEEKIDYQAKIAELSMTSGSAAAPVKTNVREIAKPTQSLQENDAPAPMNDALIETPTSAPRRPQISIPIKKNHPRETTHIKYVDVHHTIREGDILSSLVPRAAFKDFLAYNASITNPNLIYPGQKILIKIPMQNVLNSSYMNSYFVHPKTGSKEYILVKWFDIPESNSLISYLAKKSGNRINKKTIPFIDLSDYSNTVKEELFGPSIKLTDRVSKVKRISAVHTGMFFKTDGTNPLFLKNTYRGLKQMQIPGYQENINVIMDFLIRYISTMKPEKINNDFFHFLIFGETVVQVDFLSPDFFNPNPGKPHIKIGLVHKTKNTDHSLITLERSLSLRKIRRGEIAEVTRNNLLSFMK